MTQSNLSKDTLYIVYIAIEALIAVSAILGNALVIWVVKLISANQNTTFYFIVSLALADIAVGILVIPLAITVSSGIMMHFYACLFVCSLLMVFSHASIMSLMAIAVDRYLRVKFPTQYKIIVTRRRIWMALGTCWFISLLVGLVPMFGWNLRNSQNPSKLECYYQKVMNMDYVVYFSFFSWILVPLLIMCILYAEVFHIIQTKLKQNAAPIKGTGIFYRREFRTAKSLALVLFLFIVCWLPLCILNSISHFCQTCGIPVELLYVAILLSHTNSAMNPIVYALRIKKFRKTYILILKTYILCMKQEPDCYDILGDMRQLYGTYLAGCTQLQPGAPQLPFVARPEWLVRATGAVRRQQRRFCAAERQRSGGKSLRRSERRRGSRRRAEGSWSSGGRLRIAAAAARGGLQLRGGEGASRRQRSLESPAAAGRLRLGGTVGLLRGRGGGSAGLGRGGARRVGWPFCSRGGGGCLGPVG
ncbi:adenosine receptor A3-like [Eublepharis macularius]|uniref:Adenosine receptor A3 n=1 Tax=Eublepharis macularius TaxID=481883 RepID=A0AA97JE18_EUBMA|nr:adenosine receptor A3-like [Eublepharis macularius]